MTVQVWLAELHDTAPLGERLCDVDGRGCHAERLQDGLLVLGRAAAVVEAELEIDVGRRVAARREIEAEHQSVGVACCLQQAGEIAAGASGIVEDQMTTHDDGVWRSCRHTGFINTDATGARCQ